MTLWFLKHSIISLYSLFYIFGFLSSHAYFAWLGENVPAGPPAVNKTAKRVTNAPNKT